MKILIFFTVLFVVSAKSPLDVDWMKGSDRTYVYRSGQLVEFFMDLGWKEDMKAEFEKNSIFCIELIYNNITIKWDAQFTLVNKKRAVRGIERGKEFEETLFDGRKAKSQLKYNPDGDDEYGMLRNATWSSSIAGGPKIRHEFYYYWGHGWADITSQVEGKPSRTYGLELRNSCIPPPI